MNRKERRANKTGARSGENVAVLQTLTAEGLAHYQAGRLAEAERLYRQVLTIEPAYADALHLMGVLANDTGHHDIAIGLIGDAIEVRSGVYFYHNNLGNALKNAGRGDEAIKQYRRAIALKSDFAEPHNSLGAIAMERDDSEAAHNHFKRALALKPDYAEALFNAGCLFRRQERYEEALPYFEKTLVLRPGYLEAYVEIGHCQKMLDRFLEAEDSLRRVLALKPDYAEALSNLGKVLMAQGRADDGTDVLKAAVAAMPDVHKFHQDLIFSMIYAANVSPEELAVTAQHFGEKLADPLHRDRPFANDKSPGRKLRIGYVSPDFCKHSVSYFFEPLLSAHDRTQFEIYGYAHLGAAADETSERLKLQFDRWRDIAALDDAAAADLIEADGIDILVDLAGHTGSNRLLVFARKPAPVQVSWLGHPATTGLKAIDYRITDCHAEPEGMTERFNTEKLWRLPRIFCCYQGGPARPSVIGHPPADDNGYITFGCFNNIVKLTDPVLETWARIMKAVPDSRLMLELRGLEHPSFRAQFESRLRSWGMPMERIILEPRKPENQFVLYNHIDIALDPFPCAGGTTTMDTLWMGVPVVTLAGKHFVSRMGVSLLTNAGLPELIAQTTDDYVDIATRLAADKTKLRAMRDHLREKIEYSPLMDKAAFAKDMEDAYRGMWRKWCAGEKP